MASKKDPRKGKRAKSAEKWKNIGYWADPSQLLTSYSHEVLTSKKGKGHPYGLISGISEPSRRLSSGLGNSV
jgi:hypothetical protein